MINIKGELPGLLIKPIQRICKYPLLLEVSFFYCGLEMVDSESLTVAC